MLVADRNTLRPALLSPASRMMGRYFADEVLGQRKTFDKRYRIIRRNDGEERWVHGIGELELDASGAPVIMAERSPSTARTMRPRF